MKSETTTLNWSDSEREDMFHSFMSQPIEVSKPKILPTKADKPTISIYQPTTFADYIGQENPKKLASIMVRAAKQEKRPLPNMLICGGFGLGKTSLAQLIAREYGNTNIPLKDGMAINREKPDSGTIIIDEIHLLDPSVADKLNISLDANTLHIIGCTTDPGKLPAAFKSRFRLLTLSNYTVENLAQIAANVCKRKGVTANATILNYIAQRSRYNARQITVYLAMIFDLLAVNKKGTNIDQHVVNEAFALLGVDDLGYLQRDRDYLAAMPNRPIGINALSAILGIDAATIENEIEPYLLQTGIIDRTAKGRVKLSNSW